MHEFGLSESGDVSRRRCRRRRRFRGSSSVGGGTEAGTAASTSTWGAGANVPLLEPALNRALAQARISLTGGSGITVATSVPTATIGSHSGGTVDMAASVEFIVWRSIPANSTAAKGMSIRFASSGADRTTRMIDAPMVPIGETYHRPSDSTTPMLGNSVGRPEPNSKESEPPNRSGPLQNR